MSGEAARVIVLIQSTFAAGGLAYLAGRRVWWLIHDRDAWHLVYLFLWAGVGGIVIILGFVVHDQHGLNPHDWHVLAYMAALGSVDVAILGVAAFQARYPWGTIPLVPDRQEAR